MQSFSCAISLGSFGENGKNIYYNLQIGDPVVPGSLDSHLREDEFGHQKTISLFLCGGAAMKLL